LFLANSAFVESGRDELRCRERTRSVGSRRHTDDRAFAVHLLFNFAHQRPLARFGAALDIFDNPGMLL
jgi:hypothetical protein